VLHIATHDLPPIARDFSPVRCTDRSGSLRT